MQPRYEAKARVLMSLAVRPDPVTGDLMNAKTASALFENQLERLQKSRAGEPVLCDMRVQG